MLRPRRLVSLFLVITLAPILGVAWLGWRMVQQDRAVEQQRLQERCENAADIAVSALQRSIAELEGQLSSSAGPRGAEGVVLAVFNAQSPERVVGARLLYFPCLPQSKEVPAKTFSAGETLEFQKHDVAGAVSGYLELTRSTDPAIRAGAWVRLARSYRKMNDFPAALKAYNELEKLAGTPVEGEPAELVARQGRAGLFESWKKGRELADEAAALATGLAQGRWQIRRASYLLLAEETRRWSGSKDQASDPPNALALSAGVEAVWTEWRNGSLPEASQEGRQTFWADGRSVLLMWRATPERLVLLAAGPEFLEKHSPRTKAANDVRFTLEDVQGHIVLGQAASHRRAIRTMAATGLPWTLYAVPAAREAGALSGRARLLLGALTLMAVFTVAGSYFVARAVSREFAVARLQSDFVAAVSHEFRTPLTTLIQLSEMLVRGRISAEERRQEFYTTLHDESRRLHRLVEGLLDFGRLEAGEFQFRFEPVDLAALVRVVVSEFAQSPASLGYEIKLETPGEGAMVKADPEALGRVLRNLLDNAVKYSPEHRTVWVEVTRAAGRCAVSVKDRGIGIPVQEKKEIFRKFRRGTQAKTLNIKGTGIGLAMAKTIIGAHGGEISVESVPGEGSVFRVLLPVLE